MSNNQTTKLPVRARLAKVRVGLAEAGIKKSGKNTYAGYDYFELQDFMAPATKLMTENELVDEISFTADMATMTITGFEGGESVTFTCPLAEANLKGCHPVQNLGAAITYTRRYLYQIAFNIVESDTLDKTTGKTQPQAEARPVQSKQAPVSVQAKPDSFRVFNELSDSIKGAKTLIGLDLAGKTIASKKSELEESQNVMLRAMYTQRRAELGATTAKKDATTAAPVAAVAPAAPVLKKAPAKEVANV